MRFTQWRRLCFDLCTQALLEYVVYLDTVSTVLQQGHEIMCADVAADFVVEQWDRCAHQSLV